MNFLIDANLPAALCSLFEEHDVVHTLELSESNLTKDKVLNEICLRENRVLITKDTDFYYSFVAARKPHKLIFGKTREYEIRRSAILF